MNLVECCVTEIVGEPYYEFGLWWQKVKYDSYGFIDETELFHKEKSYFETVKVGFKFFA